MSDIPYDDHVEFYLDFLDKKFADEGNVFNLLVAKFGELLADRLVGASVCDIACALGRERDTDCLCSTSLCKRRAVALGG